MTTRKLVSFYEAAERMGVSYWTLWRGAQAGFFRTINVGSRRMIPVAELDTIEQYGFGNRKGRRAREANESAETR